MDNVAQDKGKKLQTEHNQAHEATEALRNMKLTPDVTRDELLVMFKFRQDMNKDVSADRDSPNAVGVSFAAPVYPPCLRPLKDLTKVMVKDLARGTHHRGSYILVRIVALADELTAVMAVVEDEKTDAVPLRLLNEAFCCQDGTLEEGRVLLVKEPYLALMSDADYVIRVDHVSDIVFAPMDDKMVPSVWREELPEDSTSQWVAGDWIAKAYKHFNRGRFYSAIECFTKALECSPTEEETHHILFFRGKAHFHVDEWDASLRDFEALPLGPKSDLALRGKAQSLYRLNRFRESCDVFTELCKKSPKNTKARDDFREAIARFAEQEKGRYNFKTMQEQASKVFPPILDHATWIGPVEVRQTETRGQGLFTTRAVKVGDLLLCEKAFAYAIEHPLKRKWANTLHINMETNTTARGGQMAIASSIINKLRKNPSLAPALTKLHSDGFNATATAAVDGTPVIDTFHISSIISLNSFSGPASSKAEHIPDVQDASGNLQTLLANGVWLLASKFNHSCMCNVNRAFIGDMIIVRAATDIPANTELTMWYLLPGPENQPMDFQHWGFECNCSMCVAISATEPHIPRKRIRLRQEIAMALENRLNVLSRQRAKLLIQQLTDTYLQGPDGALQIGLWEPLTLLASVYERQGELKEASKLILQAFEAIGFVLEGAGIDASVEGPLVVKKWGLILDGTVVAWLILRNALFEVAPGRALRADQYARLAYLICVGEDTSFDAVYGRSFDNVER
ncbi:hypothetical protein N7457_009192 [Penicillium paradoxum]|uniref:uncharacterized protein n=1 Tax=Penicillium paradoxum TaxID=176176 RepID=UPI0025477359|nr:uncharacterized protein N7457_009192 [Penicillium paradoxum]KAJ5774296.1 hypothetical protein N7457_009192 [Penicillium paradoxum]